MEMEYPVFRGPFCEEFVCSPHVCVGFPHNKNVYYWANSLDQTLMKIWIWALGAA